LVPLPPTPVEGDECVFYNTDTGTRRRYTYIGGAWVYIEW
jgi:hypothetical protein